MSENETAVEETKEVATETKVDKKAKAKPKSKEKAKAATKATVSKMTKTASKKTAPERKALDKKAKAKTKTEKKVSKRNVMVTVNDKEVEWPKKKAGVLLALRTLKKESTKIEIADELKKMGMNDGNVNKFCWELAEEKLVDMTEYEADHNWYRQITEKGKKVGLPKLYI